MDREDLLKLLDMEMKEEQYFMSVFQKEVAFFWGIISAISGGTIIGVFKATSTEHYLFLIIAPALLFSTTYFMKGSLFRSYQRFLECIVVRAKIEKALGLHKIQQETEENYWKNEPFLALRHIENRNRFNSSGEFVEFYSSRGIYEVYSNLISIIQAVSVVLAIVLFVFSVAHA